MRSEEIRKRFLTFFEKRGHAIVSSSSLIPDDSSVLLTTAGMQQFKKYFTGELDPLQDFGSKNTVSIQKSFRTSDIDEVGDETHATFFQMLGHFSFGDYFKKETIQWTYELLTEVFRVPKERIQATVFEGDEIIPFDEESFAAWSKLLPPAQIKKGSREDNVWGPAGTEGPCGACNEVYVDQVEVATLVFMEYYCHADKSLTKLTQKGVDVGWGFERIVAKLQKVNNIFETDLFAGLIQLLPSDLPQSVKRIMADHLRGICFLISDGVRPSNKEAGYILRRLMRRVIAHEHLARELSPNVTLGFLWVVRNYEEHYPELNLEIIRKVFEEEKNRFLKTIANGLRELNQLSSIDAKSAFKIFESYGLPYEIIKELGGEKAKPLNREKFEKEFKKHQAISKAGAVKKFGGHGLILNTGELKAGDEEELKKVTRLHTATHLLHQALRDVLGDSAHQMGSDITVERTRFDFTFPRKLTVDEIKKIEEIVNQKAKEDLAVSFKELPKEEAEKTGALHFFRQKYPEEVKVYYIGKPGGEIRDAYSKEFCGGPHVTRTGEIGRVKISKEEAVGAGIRRIRAILDKIA